MQPLTPTQIAGIVADANSADGLLASYEQIAERLFGPTLLASLTSGSGPAYREAHAALVKARGRKLTREELDYESADSEYQCDLERYKFIAGLLMGASFGALLLEQSKQPTRPAIKASKPAPKKGGKK